MLRLFTVVDRFQIEGRGCVLIPGLSCEPGDPVVEYGAHIRLRMPSGSELDTVIKGIENIRFAEKPQKITFPILLPNDITKEEIPIGTEVFLLEEMYGTVILKPFLL